MLLVDESFAPEDLRGSAPIAQATTLSATTGSNGEKSSSPGTTEQPIWTQLTRKYT